MFFFSELKWLHDGQEVKPDDEHIKIEKKPDGSTSLVIDEAKPEDAGKYTVLAKNDLGTDKSSAKVIVQPAESKEKKPEFLIKLTDTAVEKGEPVDLIVKVSGSPSKLKWFHDGKQISELDDTYTIIQKPDGTAILSVEHATPEIEGTYRVQATNDAGSASSSAELTVYQQPEILQGLEDAEVVEGCEVTFDVRVVSIPEAEITFYHNGQPIQPDGYYVKVKSELEGPATLTITKAKLEDAGEYRVVAKNDYGMATSDALLSVANVSLT